MYTLLDSESLVTFRVHYEVMPDETWPYEHDKDVNTKYGETYGTRVYTCKLRDLIEWAHLCKHTRRPFVLIVPRLHDIKRE